MQKYIVSLTIGAAALVGAFVAAPAAHAQYRDGDPYFTNPNDYDRYARENYVEQGDFGRRDRSRRERGRRDEQSRERGRGHEDGRYQERERFRCDPNAPQWYCEEALRGARDRRDETMFRVNPERGCAIGWRRDVPPRVRDQHMREARRLQDQCRRGDRNGYAYGDSDRGNGRRREGGGVGSFIIGVIVGAAACSAREC